MQPLSLLLLLLLLLSVWGRASKTKSSLQLNFSHWLPSMKYGCGCLNEDDCCYCCCCCCCHSGCCCRRSMKDCQQIPVISAIHFLFNWTWAILSRFVNSTAVVVVVVVVVIGCYFEKGLGRTENVGLFILARPSCCNVVSLQRSTLQREQKQAIFI